MISRSAARRRHRSARPARRGTAGSDRGRRTGARPGPRGSRRPSAAPAYRGGPHPERVRALISALEPELDGAELRAGTDAESAVRDAEIVCCATTAAQPLFPASALPAEVHVNAIGAFRPTMRELPDELPASSTIVVDELDAILEESGEIIHALGSGAITADALTELGTALAAREHGREHRREDVRGHRGGHGRTVFKTVGVAVQDWAIAHLLAGKFLP